MDGKRDSKYIHKKEGKNVIHTPMGYLVHKRLSSSGFLSGCVMCLSLSLSSLFFFFEKTAGALPFIID